MTPHEFSEYASQAATKFGIPAVLVVLSAWVGSWFGRRQKKDDALVFLQVSVAGLHEKVSTLVGDLSAIRETLEKAAKAGDIAAMRQSLEEIAREGRAVTVMTARLEERAERAEEKFDALKCQQEGFRHV